MDNPKNQLIDLNTPQGTTLLTESLASGYSALHQNFESQINGAFCGIASSVIVVNSLQYLKHQIKKQKVTQESIFRISGVDLLTEWKYGGITLDYLSKLIQKSCDALKIKVKISIWHGDKFESLEEFRSFVEMLCSLEGVFGIANYRRKSVGVGASAHISPIGAYHKDSDRILILDTNSKYYDSTWIPLHLMYDAIRTVDHHSNKYRGILVVQYLK